MQEVRRRIGAADAYRQGFYGQQIGIAVLDSGIYPHRDFTDGQNRIRVFRDFLNGRAAPYDNNGHGTHIAGIIAGSGAASGGKYMGVAPLAHLIVLKILDEKGNGTVENVSRAIEWVVQNRERFQIRIVNISVGAKVRDRRNESRALVDAVEYAWDYGLVVVAAAGNNGPDAMSITAPGTSKKVITVGAAPEQVYTKQPQVSCSFSGRGPTDECVCKPDVVAPGFRIRSCSNKPEEVYAVRSGTSMAAPVVAGGVALLLNKYPDMSNKDVKVCLRKSAVSLSMERTYQGWGMFRVSECLSGQPSSGQNGS